MNTKKTQTQRTKSRPLRTLDTKELTAVTGGLNFTKITYSP